MNTGQVSIVEFVTISMDTNKKKLEMKRRDFLKVISVTGTLAASGCAKELPEKLIPYVVQPEEVIPGIASWYAATCNECESRCGTLIKTREGRAVKVEGNPYHPVNRGGLCARGQSSIQSHYDPDRVREPLKRSANGSFKPISWKEAIADITKALVDGSTAGKKSALITEPETGSILKLIAEFAANFSGFEHYTYSLLGREEFDNSIEKAFGTGLKARYDFKQADVIVGFGADFLGTYLSPVEFTKGFSAQRVAKASKFYQLESRLSQTGGNADKWIVRSPDSALPLLLALTKLVAESKSSQAANIAKSITASYNLEDLVKGTDVSLDDLKKIAKDLLSAKAPLVLGEGFGGSSDSLYLSHLINSVLGTSALVFNQNKTKSNSRNLLAELPRLVKEAADHAVVIVSGTNPAYSLPASTQIEKALGSAGLLVAVSNNLDDTSKLANIVLPLSSSFESWSDSEPRSGVYGLNQPSMQAMYASLPLGDVLINILKEAKKKEPAVSYADYIKKQWQQRIGSDEQRWLSIVEQGGEWSSAEAKVDAAIKSVELAQKAISKAKGLSLCAFPTVQLGDGRTANRPWAQEIPDPITTAIWGSWIELHPQTATEYMLAHGDVAQITIDGVSIEAPAYVTEYVHQNALGFPIGRGQVSLGRFANGIGANPLKLTVVDAQANQLFSRSGVTLRKSFATETLVTTQGHDSQEKRGIARKVPEHDAAGHNDHHGDAHGSDHKNPHGLELNHHDPHALGPLPEQKQMYKQMPHVQYQWGMTVDLAACTGCSACVTACYAENNIAVVGKEFSRQGREMSWLKISRYLDGNKNQPVTSFMPMMCQHCNNAPCEPVCPVYATYHSDEGLNTMVYNRCVGTRYCSNNCSYKVRRFNWFDYEWPEPLNWQLNPDVTVRTVGVMEKCTFCIQRIKEVENKAKSQGRKVVDGEVQPACASSCPAEAITFGNLLDEKSKVAKLSKDKRSYRVLQVELNTQPAVTYLAKY